MFKTASPCLAGQSPVCLLVSFFVFQTWRVKSEKMESIRAARYSGKIVISCGVTIILHLAHTHQLFSKRMTSHSGAHFQPTHTSETNTQTKKMSPQRHSIMIQVEHTCFDFLCLFFYTMPSRRMDSPARTDPGVRPHT